MNLNQRIKTQHPFNGVLAYTTVVSVVGGLLLIATLFALPSNMLGLAVFALMAAVAESGNVELFHTSRGSSVSVSMIISVAAIMAIGPMAGVQIQIVSGLVNSIKGLLQDRHTRPEGRAPWFQRSAFNIGMFVISTAAAGVVFTLTGGHPGDIMQIGNLIRFPLVAATDTFANILLLLVVISLQTNQPLKRIWNQDFAWSVPISIAGGAIGGAILAFAYQSLGVFGASIFFLPVLAMGYAFRLYTNALREYVDQLEKANEELNENNSELLETMSAVIDAYDVYTLRHSRYVAEYAGALAQEMGLPKKDQLSIFRAALVHDIGKIGVYDSIISKNGVPTEEEFNLIRRHPAIGADILGRIKGFQDLIPLVRHHHEKYDGTGYPDGLKGEAIPLGARILTLADSVEAMCSDRAYRRGHEFSYVMAEVKRCTGTQFDPTVVRAFMSLVGQKGAGFFKNSAQMVDREMRLSSLAADTPHARRFIKRSLVEKNEE